MTDKTIADHISDLTTHVADMAIIEAQAAAKATTTRPMRNGCTYYFEDGTACRFFDASWVKGGRTMRTLTDDA